MPDNLAVPSWLSTKVTPLGRAPVSDSVAVGWPWVVTVKVPALPVVKVALAPEVMDGAVPPTVSDTTPVVELPALSLTSTVNVVVPAPLGVPDRVPLELKDRPGGSELPGSLAKV